MDAPLTQKELEKLRQSVNRQSPYGKLDRQMRVSEELGLESTLRLRGRPKKREMTKNSLSHFPLRNSSLMKRKQLIEHLTRRGTSLLHEGRRHSIYQRGSLKSQVPRHNEIVDALARKACKDPDVPFMRQI